MSELKLEEAPLDIEGHAQRLPCDLAGVWTYSRLQRTSARVYVPRIRLLIAAEEGEILVVPLVAALVGVVGRVVPEGKTQQIGLQRPHTRIQRPHLPGKIARAVGPLVLHIEGDANLTVERRNAAHSLRRPILDARQLLDERALHPLPANDQPTGEQVYAQEGDEVLGEQGQAIVPVGGVDHVRLVLRPPAKMGSPRLSLEEDDRVGVNRTYLAGIAIGEGTQVVVDKVHLPAADAREVVRAQQMRRAIRPHVPHPVLPPDALVSLAPDAHAVRVDQLTPPQSGPREPHVPHLDLLGQASPQQHGLKRGR